MIIQENMEIIIGKTAGFCFGVANAVNKTQELLKEKKYMYCLGELVHNKQVTEELKEKGLNIINNVEEAKQNVIIRAHGEPQETYDLANKLNINIFDLTCPKVLKIHNIAKEYSNKEFYILLVGAKNHPEIIGTISYCGKNATIIEKKEDTKEKMQEFYNSNIKKLLVIAQTTYSIKDFSDISDEIKKSIQGRNITLEIKNTICNATKLRQEETKELARKVECMIIVGGKNSSNTNKLFNIAKTYCKNSLLVETREEINVNDIKKLNKIGIMAGASTPKKSIDAIVELLQSI